MLYLSLSLSLSRTRPLPLVSRYRCLLALLAHCGTVSDARARAQTRIVQDGGTLHAQAHTRARARSQIVFLCHSSFHFGNYVISRQCQKEGEGREKKQDDVHSTYYPWPTDCLHSTDKCVCWQGGDGGGVGAPLFCPCAQQPKTETSNSASVATESKKIRIFFSGIRFFGFRGFPFHR